MQRTRIRNQRANLRVAPGRNDEDAMEQMEQPAAARSKRPATRNMTPTRGRPPRDTSRR